MRESIKTPFGWRNPDAPAVKREAEEAWGEANGIAPAWAFHSFGQIGHRH
jgi:hypothetical protein